MKDAKLNEKCRNGSIKFEEIAFKSLTLLFRHLKIKKIFKEV